MSLSDVQKNLGIEVSKRQFRRYAEAGVFVPALVGKNKSGRLVMVNPPQTLAAWDRLRHRIEEWRLNRYARGWRARPRAKIKPREQQKGFEGHLTLEQIHMDFLRWESRSKEDRQTRPWNQKQFLRIAELLKPMAKLFDECVSNISPGPFKRQR